MELTPYSPLQYEATSRGSMSVQLKDGGKFNSKTALLHTGGKNGGMIKGFDEKTTFDLGFPSGLTAGQKYTKKYPDDFMGASVGWSKSSNGAVTEVESGELIITFSNSNLQTKAEGSFVHNYKDGSTATGTFDITNTYTKY